MPRRAGAKPRLELRQEQADRAAEKAELVAQTADVAARLRAAEHRFVDHYIGGRIRDPEPFWQHTQHHDLLDGNGDLDLGRVDEHLGTLLQAKPYLAAPTYPPTPNSDAKIGIPPTSVLAPTAGEPTPGWSEVLRARSPRRLISCLQNHRRATNSPGLG